MNRSQDVNRAEHTATDSSSDDQTAHPSSEPASGASDQTDGGSQQKQSQQVPYDRFKEVNDSRRAAEERAHRLEQMLSQQQQYLQNLQQQQASQAQQNQGPDPDEELVMQILGNDEVGKKAYEAIDKVARKRAKQEAEALKQQLLNDVNSSVDSKIGGVTASFKTKQTIDTLQQSGRIDKTTADTLHQQVQSAINQYPQWANQQDLLLNTLMGQMYASGKLASPGNSMNGTPLQPGGNAPAQTGSSEQARYAEVLRRFPSLKNKSDKELRRVVEETQNSQSDMQAALYGR